MDEFIEKIIVERNKVVDDIILGEIQKIATENGVVTKITLNEKAIVLALKKQIPTKPTPQKVETDRILIGNGYWCKGTTVYRCPNCEGFTTKLYKHCGNCGQAIDWGDSE